MVTVMPAAKAVPVTVTSVVPMVAPRFGETAVTARTGVGGTTEPGVDPPQPETIRLDAARANTSPRERGIGGCVTSETVLHKAARIWRGYSPAVAVSARKTSSVRRLVSSIVPSVRIT